MTLDLVEIELCQSVDPAFRRSTTHGRLDRQSKAERSVGFTESRP